MNNSVDNEKKLFVIGIDARYGLRKNRRGIGNYIFRLLSELQRLKPDGFRFVLYADRAADPAVMERFQGGLFTVRAISVPNFAWWEQVALPLAARRDKVDLFHCTSNIAPVLFKPCRLVTTIHDVIEFRRREFGDTKLSFRHRLSRAYRMGVLPRVARLSDLLITDSGFSGSDIAAVLKVSPAKIRVVPIATTRGTEDESEESQGTQLNRLSFTNGDYIFALGAVDRRKNTARLFEAYRRLRTETGTDVVLVVAGIEKPEAFRPLVGDGVHLLGFLPDETIAALYRHALFFVYPSLYEGFGLPVLEAMSYSIPVACSETTAVGEVAGDAALKFDPTSTDDMAAKMRQLLLDPALRAKLVERGRERVKDFSWVKCARETLAAYREVLEGGR